MRINFQPLVSFSCRIRVLSQEKSAILLETMYYLNLTLIWKYKGTYKLLNTPINLKFLTRSFPEKGVTSRAQISALFHGKRDAYNPLRRGP